MCFCSFVRTIHVMQRRRLVPACGVVSTFQLLYSAHSMAAQRFRLSYMHMSRDYGWYTYITLIHSNYEVSIFPEKNTLEISTLLVPNYFLHFKLKGIWAFSKYVAFVIRA